MSKYVPATFQPVVRPDWGGTLGYLSDEEKSAILTAIIKYPSVECDSRFWLETIKPDLDLQFETFTKLNAVKSRGVRERWAKTSITPVKVEYNTSIRPVIDVEKEREREYINNIFNNNINNSRNLRTNEESNLRKKTTRVKSNNDFIPPTLNDCRDYAHEIHCWRQLGTDFYNYYSVSDWIDSKGKKIKNWKQKMLQWYLHDKDKYYKDFEDPHEPTEEEIKNFKRAEPLRIVEQGDDNATNESSL